MKYAQKLRDPRWQKLRLEVMQRDKFTCQQCGIDELTLHVHHCYYDKNKEPWDYELTSLVTLCEECHKKEDEALKEKIAFTNMLSSKGLLANDFNELTKAISNSDIYKFTEYDVGALCFALEKRSILNNLFDMYIERLTDERKD